MKKLTRLAATIASVALVGAAACEKQGGGDHQGGGTEGMPQTDAQINGGATSGSGAGPAETAGSPGVTPGGAAAATPADSATGGVTPASAGVPVPQQQPGTGGNSTISTPSGNGTPPPSATGRGTP